MKPKNPDQVGGRWSKDPIPGVLGLVGGKSRILGTYKRILRLRDHETWRISEIRLAISWGASGSIGIPVVNCGGDPAKSRCRMHLKNIHKNPFKQVAFQDCEDSKVTTNLQKVRQEKKRNACEWEKKWKTKPPKLRRQKGSFFFGRLLQTGPPPDWSAWTSMGEFLECGVSASRKKTDGSEAGSQRRTLNPVDLGERWGVAQQVAGELAGELYIIYTPCGSCQNTCSQWIKFNIGLISIKLNK